MAPVRVGGMNTQHTPGFRILFWQFAICGAVAPPESNEIQIDADSVSIADIDE